MRATANPGLDRLRRVRPEVERACCLLSSPSAEGLDRCADVLKSACSELARCQQWARGPQANPEALAEAYRLQEAVRRVSHLLQIARDYHTTWCHKWATLTSGYTPGGLAPAPVRRGLVSLAG